MNIKKKVKFSFLIIIFSIIVIFMINSLTLYQVKENNETKSNISNLVYTQHKMNSLVKDLLNTKTINEIKKIKNDFVSFELQFEEILDIFKNDTTKDFIDNFIKDIHKYDEIKINLEKISKSEKTIEKYFDEIIKIQTKKIELTNLFAKKYPDENLQRNKIERIIEKRKDIKSYKTLSNIKYYSKETLFQHKNSRYLNKWLKEIEKLNELSFIDNNDLLNEYYKTAKMLGLYSIQLNEIKNKELFLQNEIFSIVDKNTKLLNETKNNIDRLSESFIDKFYYTVLFILVLTVLFILILSIKVNKNVVMSFEQIEDEVNKGLEEIRSLNNEIENTQKEVVFTMGSIGESRSKETGNHVKRVAEYSKLLALKYGLDKKEAELLKQASPMHDIGKVAIPDSILNKPGRFDDNERKIMNTHAKLGYDMLKHSSRPLLETAAIVSLQHHEKWDGTGYPNGLKGEEIHIYGRITALADVFDALGSDRCYKKAWEDEKIFKLFKEEKAKHFDPKLIDIFFDNLDDFLKIRDTFKD